jgi:DNA-binding transcriptional LysR family regulator
MGAFESYVCAVQTGSLSGAARHRNMSQPAISQQISALESYYDTRLLHRDRNGVRMTPSGEVLYSRAVNILDEQAHLKADIETLMGTVAGDLSVAANLACCQSIVGDVVIQLARKYSDLKVELRAEDHDLDLVAEKIDLALWSGSFGSGNGVVRKIATQTMVHVATPAYLDNTMRPTKPEDLVNLDYIQYRADDDQVSVVLTNGSETVHAPIKTSLTAQFPELLNQALSGNLGYAKAPLFLIKEAIEAGYLEEVLPQWRLADKDLFLAYPAQEDPSLRIVAFLKVLMARLEAIEGIKVVASARKQVVPNNTQT